MGGGRKEVKSARGIEAFYMYFNGTGIWGGETINAVDWVFFHSLEADNCVSNASFM